MPRGIEQTDIENLLHSIVIEKNNEMSIMGKRNVNTVINLLEILREQEERIVKLKSFQIEPPILEDRTFILATLNDSPISFNQRDGIVKHNGERCCYLSTKESALLGFLAQNENKIVSLNEICKEVHGNTRQNFLHLTRSQIDHVRTKFKRIDPDLSIRLENVRGLGYRWNNDIKNSQN